MLLKRLGEGVRQVIKKSRWVLLMANFYLHLNTIDENTPTFFITRIIQKIKGKVLLSVPCIHFQ